MNFPMLKMLAEGKKKAADMDADMDLEMEIDTSMEPEVEPKKDKGEAPVTKAVVLKFLKDASPKDRKAICDKLKAMVTADEESAGE